MLCILMSKLQFKLCQNLRSLRAPIIFSSCFYGSHCSKTNYPPIEQPLSSSECFIAVTCLRINVVPNHPQLPMLPQDQLHHFPARIIGPEHTCPLRSPIISCSCFIGFNAVFLNHPHTAAQCEINL